MVYICLMVMELHKCTTIKTLLFCSVNFSNYTVGNQLVVSKQTTFKMM